MLQCACCHVELRPVIESGIEIDVCDQCFSAWFDQGELNLVASDFRLNIDTAIIDVAPHSNNDLCCPRCKTSNFTDLTMDRLTVSRCEDCGGMHIDAGSQEQLGGLRASDFDSKLGTCAGTVGQLTVEFITEGLCELVFHLLFAL